MILVKEWVLLSLHPLVKATMYAAHDTFFTCYCNLALSKELLLRHNVTSCMQYQQHRFTHLIYMKAHATVYVQVQYAVHLSLVAFATVSSGNV